MDRQGLLQQSKTLLDSISTWKPGKTYHSHTTNPSITTFIHTTTNKDDEFWCCRTSKIPITYKSSLLECIIGKPELESTHSDHEVKYIKEIKSIKVDNIQEFPDGWSYELRADYEFGLGLSKRRFYEMQQVYKLDKENCAYILSIPILGPSDGDYIIGKYHSIERVSWDSSGVEWMMATTSDPGGSIPKWITKLSVPGAIAKDVPSVLKYIQNGK